MERVFFLDCPQFYNPDLKFVAHLSKINSKNGLFKTLNIKLKLPDYFGFNWDALSECLKDFHWIPQQGIVIVHDELPAIDEASLHTYMNILIDAVDDWKEGDEHYLEIVFPKNAENLLWFNGDQTY